MTYAQLVALIQSYTENEETDFVANIPMFVRMAEERIYRYIKLPRLRKTQTSQTAAGQRSRATPSDFLSVDSLAILEDGTYSFLVPKEPDWIREAYPGALQDKPKYYALLNHNTLILGPTPDATYTIEMNYNHKPQSIVDSSTSWLGDNAENALLYGSLVEAYTFMKGEADLMKLYNDRFLEAVGRTKVLAEGRDRTDEYRNPPDRVEAD